MTKTITKIGDKAIIEDESGVFIVSNRQRIFFPYGSQVQRLIEVMSLSHNRRRAEALQQQELELASQWHE